MAAMQQLMAVFTRRAQGAMPSVGRTGPVGLAVQLGQTPQPSHPAQPAWMVPAYQRRRLSGDRVAPR